MKQFQQRAAAVLLLAPGLFLAGCDDAGVNEFPYVERVVVGSILDAGSDTLLILFGRTLPVDEPYDPLEAALSGVTGAVSHGADVFPLVQLEPGLYYASGIRIVAGEAYELTAEWQGKRVSAATRVPFPPTVVSATAVIDSAVSTSLELTTVIRAGTLEVYGQTWLKAMPTDSERGGSFTEIVRSSDADVDGTVSVSERYVLTLSPRDTLYAISHAFDESFYDFFVSRGGNIPGYDDLLFRELGGFVSWNVKGDGIGLFLGRAVTQTRADLR